MSEARGPTGTPEPEEEAGPARSRSFGATFLHHLTTANAVTVTVLAVVLAMLVGAVLIIISDPNVRGTYAYFLSRPTDALSASWTKVSDAYANLFRGAVLDPEAVRGVLAGDLGWERVFRPLSETLTYATPLVFTGLAFALAFRGGLFNIGVQGQAVLGAIGAALAGFLLPLPVGLHLLAALLAGALFGASWGFIPGILKARTGAHEVITTIMLNYIALGLLTWLILRDGIQDPNRADAISRRADDTARLPELLGWLGPSLRVNLGIVVAVLVVAAVAWLLNRSTFGFELRAVGLNPDASRTAGIGVMRTYAAVMVVSGVLGGLGGAAMVLGPAGALTPQVIGTAGFDGILVGLLGRGKPWGVLLAALLFGALQAGGNRMQVSSGISLELVQVLQALIVIFVAAPALVQAIFRLRATRVGSLQTGTAKGW
jgi:simple sugar transport system permease protein